MDVLKIFEGLDGVALIVMHTGAPGLTGFGFRVMEPAGALALLTAGRLNGNLGRSESCRRL